MLTGLDHSNLQVLVVEDSLYGVALMGQYLLNMGIHPVIDSTGHNVLRIAYTMQPGPDIIFMDLMLPDLSGYDLLKTIRADRILRDRCVVAVSAMDPRTAIPKCQEIGFNGFIAKPFNEQKFAQYVDCILDGRAVWDNPYEASVCVLE